MLEKSGRFVQHVVLQAAAFDLDAGSYSALLSLVKGSGALRSFTLDPSFGGVLDTCLFHRLDNHSQSAALPNMYSVIQAVSTQHCTLHIDFTFSDFNGSTHQLYSDVFHCDPSSDLWCKRLRALTIQFMDSTEEDLRQKVDPPRSHPTPELVSRFPSIQHLSLSELVFSDHLLEMLEDMARRYGVLRTPTVTFEPCEYTYADKVEELSSAAWSRLVEACRGLQVFSSFHSVGCVLKPEAPVVSVTIRSYHEGEIDFEQLETFCSHHCSTLESLEYAMEDGAALQNFQDGEPEELPVVSIATGCPRLVHLYYKGIITRTDVLRLAEMDGKWRTLVIDSGHVRIREGESVVSDDDLLEVLDELTLTVSQCLGYPWTFDGQ